MHTFRTALIIGLGTLGILSLAGCSSDDDSAATETAPPEQEQPVALKKAESGQWRLPEPREGVFLVVVCRASNLEGLAVSRRDGFRTEDLTEALRGNLEQRLTGQLALHRENFPGASAFDIINFFDAEIREAAATATFDKHEVVKVNSAAYAAYVLAELKHADIRSALEERARGYAQQHNWNEEEFLSLLADAVAALDTGVGGNDNYVSAD